MNGKQDAGPPTPTQTFTPIALFLACMTFLLCSIASDLFTDLAGLLLIISSSLLLLLLLLGPHASSASEGQYESLPPICLPVVYPIRCEQQKKRGSAYDFELKMPVTEENRDRPDRIRSRPSNI